MPRFQLKTGSGTSGKYKRVLQKMNMQSWGERGAFAYGLNSVFKSISKMWLVLALSMAANTTFSQSETNPDQEELKAAFQQELDKWMLQAYDGNKVAQFRVAVMFANGQFMPPDYEQSSYWYQQAARQGHVLAQYNLGHQYLTGTGVKRDEKSAMQWWLKAAEQQHALAQFNVGRAYYLGIGLDKDLSQARLWFERASQNNEPKSTEILKQLGWWDEAAVASVSQPQATSYPIAADDSLNRAEFEAQKALAAAPTQASLASKSTVSTQPIAVFTDPSVRSVLISIIEDPSTLEVLQEDTPWTIVRSKQGLPVWVHKNFLSVSGKQATVTGNSVNARSVPLITNGSVIGRLNKNEKLKVISIQGEWYRVTSPTRFKGWVKSEDLNPAKQQKMATTEQPNKFSATPVLNNVSKLNDNKWLFDQDEAHYSLQLASFSDEQLLTRFVKELPFRESDDLRLFTAKNDKGTEWTYVLYGNFSDDVMAKSARRELNQDRAWIRRFGVLQQNRCLAWKKELPTPRELNDYCT